MFYNQGVYRDNSRGYAIMQSNSSEEDKAAKEIRIAVFAVKSLVPELANTEQTLLNSMRSITNTVNTHKSTLQQSLDISDMNTVNNALQSYEALANSPNLFANFPTGDNATPNNMAQFVSDKMNLPEFVEHSALIRKAAEAQDAFRIVMEKIPNKFKNNPKLLADFAMVPGQAIQPVQRLPRYEIILKEFIKRAGETQQVDQALLSNLDATYKTQILRNVELNAGVLREVMRNITAQVIETQKKTAQIEGNPYIAAAQALESNLNKAVKPDGTIDSVKLKNMAAIFYADAFLDYKNQGMFFPQKKPFLLEIEKGMIALFNIQHQAGLSIEQEIFTHINSVPQLQSAVSSHLFNLAATQGVANNNSQLYNSSINILESMQKWKPQAAADPKPPKTEAESIAKNLFTTAMAAGVASRNPAVYAAAAKLAAQMGNDAVQSWNNAATSQLKNGSSFLLTPNAPDATIQAGYDKGRSDKTVRADVRNAFQAQILINALDKKSDSSTLSNQQQASLRGLVSELKGAKNLDDTQKIFVQAFAKTYIGEVKKQVKGDLLSTMENAVREFNKNSKSQLLTGDPNTNKKGGIDTAILNSIKDAGTLKSVTESVLSQAITELKQANKSPNKKEQKAHINGFVNSIKAVAKMNATTQWQELVTQNKLPELSIKNLLSEDNTAKRKDIIALAQTLLASKELMLTMNLSNPTPKAAVSQPAPVQPAVIKAPAAVAPTKESPYSSVVAELSAELLRRKLKAANAPKVAPAAEEPKQKAASTSAILNSFQAESKANPLLAILKKGTVSPDKITAELGTRKSYVAPTIESNPQLENAQKNQEEAIAQKRFVPPSRS